MKMKQSLRNPDDRDEIDEFVKNWTFKLINIAPDMVERVRELMFLYSIELINDLDLMKILKDFLSEDLWIEIFNQYDKAFDQSERKQLKADSNVASNDSIVTIKKKRLRKRKTGFNSSLDDKEFEIFPLEDIKSYIDRKKMTRFIRKRAMPNVWDKKESCRLRELVDEHGIKSWKKIAEIINMEFSSSKRPEQCSQHYHRVAAPHITHSPWTEDEDKNLLLLSAKYTFHWHKIAKLMNGRTDTMCRRRYLSIKSKNRNK